MDNKPPSPRGSLLTTRIIWAALLLGQVLFLVVILFMRKQHAPSTPPPPVLAYVAIAMVIAAAPAGFVIRRLVYSPHENGHVAPAKYGVGNLIFMAMLEGPSFFGLVVFLLGDPLGLAASGVAIAIQALNFPTGAPLELD